MSEAEKGIKELKDQYSTEGIYSRLVYGAPMPSKGLKHAVSICQNWSFRISPQTKILVVGAGAGYELVVFYRNGYECYGIDLHVPNVKTVKERSAIASADAIPFKDKEFDLLFCTEMLEHVPLEMTDDILNECRRVAVRFYFTIATVMDTGFNTHINVHPGYFWIEKFETLGFDIRHAEVTPIVHIVLGGKHIIRYDSRNYGVLLYGMC